MKAAHVTTAKLRQYVDDRQREGAATATINRELAALRRMFYLGHESTPKKVLDVPHFLMLRENNTRTGFPEDSQYQNLVEGAELWLRALIECGSTICWRHEELISLRVKQLSSGPAWPVLPAASQHGRAGATVMRGTRSPQEPRLAADHLYRDFVGRDTRHGYAVVMGVPVRIEKP